MKLFIAAILCIVAAGADRLENTYLPPSGALSAGGDGNALNAPLGSSDPSSGKQEDSHSYRKTGNGKHSDQQNPDANAATLRFQNENNADGTYNFEFETENRIYQQESGELRNLGGEEGEVTVVRGSYSYLAPDGQMYTVEYIADENGFQPSGEHIPEVIQKSTQANNGNFDYQGEVEQNRFKSTPNNQNIHSTTSQNNNYESFNTDTQNGFRQTNALHSSEEHNNNQHHEQSGYPLNLAPLQNVNTEVINQYNGIPHPVQHKSETHEEHGHSNNAQIASISDVHESAEYSSQGFIKQQDHAIPSRNQELSRNHHHESHRQPGNQFSAGTHTRISDSNSGHPATSQTYEIESHNSHESHSGYPVSSGIHESQGHSGYPASSGTHESHGQSGYPVSSGSHESHGHSGYPVSSVTQESQDHSGYPASFGHPEYPVSSQMENHNEHDISSGLQVHPGYPASSDASHQNVEYPTSVSQGQEQSVVTGVHLDNVDSSHQHDDAEEEKDAVVVEAAGRRYQPPQTPRGRATPGQQAFNEQTGYQY